MAAFLRHLFERVNPGRIDGRHVAHAQDENLRRLGDVGQHRFDLVRGAKEERAVDLVHLDAGRDLAAGDEALAAARLRDLAGIFIRIADLVAHAFDVGHVAHALHEQQCRDHDPDLHGHGQVDEDRQREGENQHHQIAARRAQQAGERAPLAHVVRDDDEDRGQRAERHHRRPFAEQ